MMTAATPGLPAQSTSAHRQKRCLKMVEGGECDGAGPGTGSVSPLPELPELTAIKQEQQPELTELQARILLSVSSLQIVGIQLFKLACCRLVTRTRCTGPGCASGRAASLGCRAGWSSSPTSPCSTDWARCPPPRPGCS